ncbi:hydrolase TatD [Shewanella morhuae]|uniref:Deoxyribonuclease TatD n=1 Tax=Shewanella morhuae TaxID=365591 RepID=A0A1N6WXN2_9GAMM|nr:TatD family hydrolase [Shewanella morhuae]PTA51509.1 hydrolase TatD [Shewanella morhuae]GIU02949.1 DNase TatD [Shewanella morhuae]SIQ94781.1 Sec-independent protein translocase TatD [Shewanella morhuae]SUI83803.1 Deoxyribonuclease TatD [Shewanella morhuae]
MPSYIDVAVNLLGSALEADIALIIQAAADQGVSPLIVIGSDLAESAAAITVCQQYPRQLYCTAGVHPHHASGWNAESSIQQAELCQAAQVVAVGECGLDYNRDFSPRSIQRQAFIAQLELAINLQMPVLMHERDAHEDFIAILREYRPQLTGALLHCFTGTHEQMEAYIDLDLHLGITGWVCDERRGQALAELVPYIPQDRILIETDSPYLLPRSMRPKPKSSKNKPEYLPYIANYIANLRGENADEFSERCYQNSLAFFKLDQIHA